MLKSIRRIRKELNISKPLMRCNICSSVSHTEVCLDLEDYHSGSFYPDPGRIDGYLCSECYSEYLEVRSGYDLEDEAEMDDILSEEFEE